MHKFIELPLIAAISEGVRSALPPAVLLTTLLNDYETHKEGKKYETAVKQSQQHEQGEESLSRKPWWAQFNYAQGEKWSEKVKDGDVEYFQLDEEKQQMVLDFDSEALKRKLDKALEEKASKRPCYRGAGAETQTTD